MGGGGVFSNNEQGGILLSAIPTSIKMGFKMFSMLNINSNFLRFLKKK